MSDGIRFGDQEPVASSSCDNDGVDIYHSDPGPDYLDVMVAGKTIGEWLHRVPRMPRFLQTETRNPNIIAWAIMQICFGLYHSKPSVPANAKFFFSESDYYDLVDLLDHYRFNLPNVIGRHFIYYIYCHVIAVHGHHPSSESQVQVISECLALRRRNCPYEVALVRNYDALVLPYPTEERPITRFFREERRLMEERRAREGMQ